MSHLNHSNSSQSDAFPARLLALSTLQILAGSTHFTSLRPGALDTLTHVAARYLQLMAEAVRAHADHSGRAHLNAWDVSGVFESLQGPGALSSLHNWSIDNLQPQSTITPLKNSNPNLDLNVIQDQILKLKSLAQNLPRQFQTSLFLPNSLYHFSSLQLISLPTDLPLLCVSADQALATVSDPITSLSFLPLTDAEVAALDRAGETDLEDEPPSPHPSSTDGSSEDDSDFEIHYLKPIQPATEEPVSPLSPSSLGITLRDPPQTESLVDRWRSIEDIPAYVPAYFPPLPGLERIIPGSMNEDPMDEPVIVPEPIQPSSPTPPSALKHDPYLTATPFTKSQLFEQYGSTSFPHLPPFPTVSSPPPVEGADHDMGSPPPLKKPKLTDPMEYFNETYAFLLEDKPSARTPDQLLKRNPRRKQLISSQPLEPFSDSLFGTIPVSSIRSNRWSAGWIPHPPVHAGQLLPVPELKPFGHTPLPVPLTIPVPLDFPPAPLLPQSHPRIPALIPNLFNTLSSQSLSPDTFTLFNRLTRLGPPCELGHQGEPTAYRVKQQAATEVEGQKPQYMEWGFHWPSHHGHEPLGSPPERSSFVHAPFPAMPKTAAERARLAQLEREAAMDGAKAVQDDP